MPTETETAAASAGVTPKFVEPEKKWRVEFLQDQHVFGLFYLKGSSIEVDEAHRKLLEQRENGKDLYKIIA